VVDGTPPKKLRKQTIGQAPSSPAGASLNSRCLTSSPTSSYTDRNRSLTYDDGNNPAPRVQKRGRSSSRASSYTTHTPSCDDTDDPLTRGRKRGRPISHTSSYRIRRSSHDDAEDSAHRGRKQGRTSSPTSSYYRTHTSPLASLSSPDRKRLKTPQIRTGVRLSGKPKASDYEDVVKRRLLEAMSIYETYIFTNEAYPPQELQFKWIREAWRLASVDAEVQYELMDRMLRLVRFSLAM
jgi:hypothetical protein